MSRVDISTSSISPISNFHICNGHVSNYSRAAHPALRVHPAAAAVLFVASTGLLNEAIMLTVQLWIVWATSSSQISTLSLQQPSPIPPSHQPRSTLLNQSTTPRMLVHRLNRPTHHPAPSERLIQFHTPALPPPTSKMPLVTPLKKTSAVATQQPRLVSV